jgi:hypothetical protein
MHHKCCDAFELCPPAFLLSSSRGIQLNIPFIHSPVTQVIYDRIMCLTLHSYMAVTINTFGCSLIFSVCVFVCFLEGAEFQIQTINVMSAVKPEGNDSDDDKKDGLPLKIIAAQISVARLNKLKQKRANAEKLLATDNTVSVAALSSKSAWCIRCHKRAGVTAGVCDAKECVRCDDPKTCKCTHPKVKEFRTFRVHRSLSDARRFFTLKSRV